MQLHNIYFHYTTMHYSMNLLLETVIQYSSHYDKQAFSRHKYSHSKNKSNITSIAKQSINSNHHNKHTSTRLIIKMSLRLLIRWDYSNWHVQ